MPDHTALTSRDDWMAILSRHGDGGYDAQRRNRVLRRIDVEWGLATISVAGLERPADAPPLTMTLLDISPNGVMLRSFEPLKRGVGIGMLLTIGEDEAWLQGYVMHCTPMLGGHKVGVQLHFDDAAACA